MKLYDARDAARHPATRGILYPMAKWDGKFQKFPQKIFFACVPVETVRVYFPASYS